MSGLTKRYGGTTAVDDLSFQVRPGQVTGFLGPNGAGKSTTLRMILGLDRPTTGSAIVDGRPFSTFRRPLSQVGALIDASAAPSGRSGQDHLRALARSNGIGSSRVAEVLSEVGLETAARKRIGGYSLGMKQRLGIAAALLGDPHTLIFDEPVNGLDPEGMRWIRGLFRRKAEEGRTVFVSSHLMSEMQDTADHLIVIGQGRLIADTTLAALVRQGSEQLVSVRTPSPDELRDLLTRDGALVRAVDGQLEVIGLPANRIGDLALAAGIALHELRPHASRLEDVFMNLVSGRADFHAAIDGKGN